MKRCSTCKQFFPLTLYGPDKRKRDSLQPQCRMCRRLVMQKYHKTQKGRETVRRAKERYRQTAKGQEKERQYKQTEKYKEAARLYGQNYRKRPDYKEKQIWLSSPKRKAYAAQYWKLEKNKLRMKEHQRKYNLSEKGKQKMERQRQSIAFRAWFRSPQGKAFRSRRNYIRRPREKAADVGRVTPAQWEAIKQQFSYCCAYCGKPESATLKLTQDHFIPINKLLGPHTVDNIVPACQVCNSRKGAQVLTHRPQPSHPVIAESTPGKSGSRSRQASA